jgi:hypothetical protein
MGKNGGKKENNFLYFFTTVGILLEEFWLGLAESAHRYFEHLLWFRFYFFCNLTLL